MTGAMLSGEVSRVEGAIREAERKLDNEISTLAKLEACGLFFRARGPVAHSAEHAR